MWKVILKKSYELDSVFDGGQVFFELLFEFFVHLHRSKIWILSIFVLIRLFFLFVVKTYVEVIFQLQCDEQMLFVDGVFLSA